MASTNNVIFLESMADILANPVDICFSTMPAKFTALVTCVVIEGNAVTSDQQVESDLLAETHPPTPRDLIVGLDRAEGMLSDTIKICERVKRPHTTSTPPTRMPLGLWNAAHIASLYMKRKIQMQSGPKTSHCRGHRGYLDDPCPNHEKSKHTARQRRILKKLRRPLLMAHLRQINREPSPDLLAFQIARTTISLNYTGEVFEIPDYEVLVVSANMPPKPGETEEQLA
jgi:hypothetical protein